MRKTILLLTLIISFTGCGNNKKNGSETQRPVIKDVSTKIVEPVSVNRYYRTSGTVESSQTSNLASRIMASVTSVLVEEGESVKKDQLLLTLDDEAIADKLNAAEREYDESVNLLEIAAEKKRLSELTWSRYNNLFTENAISRQEMDEIDTKRNIANIEYNRAEATVGKARANLSDARTTLSFTRIKSPVDGILSKKMVDKGTLVTPGVPLLLIENNSAYKLEIDVDEMLIDKINKGDTVEINIGSVDKKIKGVISEIVGSVDPATRTFPVRIRLVNNQLRSGLFATVSIPYKTEKTILVPPDAIVRKGQLEGVYTVGKDGVVSYRLIKTGRSYENGLEILSGLRSGERIIVHNALLATDGGIVEEQQ